MTKYAAHDNFSIYAVGETSDQVLAAAREMVGPHEPEPQFDVSPISDTLFTQIERDGWNGNRRSFEIDHKTGEIVDTTDL